MRKHNYTEIDAPTNTGSLSRPGRLNLRLDCQTRGQTHELFIRAREVAHLPPNAPFAEVWERALLPWLQHLMRAQKWGSSAEKALVSVLMQSTVPKEDYLRERARRLTKACIYAGQSDVSARSGRAR